MCSFAESFLHHYQLNADSSFIKYCQDYGKKKIVGEKLIWELVENKVRAAVFMEKKQYEICS